MKFLEILTLSDLCSFLNISEKELKFLRFAKPAKKYTMFTIPKNSGGVRVIYAPKEQLKSLHWFLKEQIEPLAYDSSFAHGFVKGKSIVSNAELHKGKRFVANFDIKNFFESIHIGRVIGLFCKKPFHFTREVSVALAQIICMDGRLVQGSPISPLVSNMIFYTTDRNISKYIRGKNITYTRYADDLTFSFNNKKFVKMFIDEGQTVNGTFEKMFLNAKFSLNSLKTRIQYFNMHQQVTGITVNDKNNLNLNHFQKYRIRGLLNAISKYGLEESAKHFCELKGREYVKDRSEKQMLDYLKGCISYYKMVRGNTNGIYCKLALKYNELVHKRVFELKTNDKDVLFDNSILLIDNADICYGTAFFYRGYVVTCEHCVEGLLKEGNDYYFSYKNIKDKERLAVKILKAVSDRDICIGKPASSISLVNFVKSSKAIRKNDQINAIGFPDFNKESDYDVSMVPGSVVAERIINGVKCWTSTNRIQKGLSGGPVLNSKGEVVGMVVYGIEKDEYKIENGFIDISYIDELIDSL